MKPRAWDISAMHHLERASPALSPSRYQMPKFRCGKVGEILLAILLLTILPCLCFAQDSRRFSDKETGLGLNIPEGYVQREISPPAVGPRVLLALAPVEGGFPTVTVLAQPHDVSLSPEQLIERTLEEYRRAGFTDAVVHERMSSLDDSVRIEIRYTQSGAPFTAHVGLTARGTKSFVETVVAPEGLRERARRIFEEVLAATTFPDGDISHQNGSSGEVRSSRSAGLIALLVASLIALAYWRSHHRAKQSR